MRTSKMLAPRSAMSCTSPTMVASTVSSDMAPSGISTLCSTAMPWARAAMEAASARMW